MRAILVLTLILTSVSAHALSVNGGKAIISGPDCSDSNTQVVFSADFKTFSILYSTLSVSSEGLTAGEDGVKRTPYKQCKIRIPYVTTPGTQIELQQIDYRGYMSSPSPKSYAWVESHHQFINGSVVTGLGRWESNQMIGSIGMYKTGPFADEFTWGARFTGTSPKDPPNLGLHISDCSGKATLAVDASVHGHSFDPTVDVAVILDTADAHFGNDRNKPTITYRVVENSCDAWNKRRDKICKRGTCGRQ